MLIEVWSDVVCPFCYLGKRHLTAALERFEHADEVEVRWRSFQLDPTATPGEQGSMAAGLAAKYGMSLAEAEANQANLRATGAEVGIDFRWDLTRPDTTIDAHRLRHLVTTQHPEAGDAVVEDLFRAHFTEGRLVSDQDELVEIAVGHGLDGEAVKAALSGDDGADAVQQDLAQARAYEITAVPFFVINQAVGVPGAQPPEVLLSALEQAWEADDRPE